MLNLISVLLCFFILGNVHTFDGGDRYFRSIIRSSHFHKVWIMSVHTGLVSALEEIWERRTIFRFLSCCNWSHQARVMMGQFKLVYISYIWSFIIRDWKFVFVFWIYECKYCSILNVRYISHHQSVLETICFWNRGLWKVTAHCWNSACRVRLQGVPKQAKQFSVHLEIYCCQQAVIKAVCINEYKIVNTVFSSFI